MVRKQAKKIPDIVVSANQGRATGGSGDGAEKKDSAQWDKLFAEMQADSSPGPTDSPSHEHHEHEKQKHAHQSKKNIAVAALF